MINRFFNIFIDHSDTALSYKTIVMGFISGAGMLAYSAYIEPATEIVKLIGAILMLIPMIMNILINRKRYKKVLKNIFNSCPENDNY